MARWCKVNVVMLLAASWGVSHALIINGEEIEDLWGYVHKVLAEDQAAWQARQEQAARNPSFGLARHYDYAALRLLTEEELVRAALQGAYAARREMASASPKEIELKEEANISFILEYFPLLLRDVNSSDPLFTVLEGGSGRAAGQLFLLKRAVPGKSMRTSFTDYWQEEVVRRDRRFRKVMTDLCETRQLDDARRILALEVLYVHHVRVLDDFIQRDPNVIAHRASGGSPVSAEELVVRDDLTLEPWNLRGFEDRLTQFVDLAKLYGDIVDPKSKAPQDVRKTARELIERIYQDVPLSPEDQAAVKKILDEQPL